MKSAYSVAFPIENDVDKGILKILQYLKNYKKKWAALNAINHMHYAWLIKEIDPNMAAFRMLTAEEEAATAVILSVKALNYSNAKMLNETNHQHKNSLIPLIEIMSQRFVEDKNNLPEIKLFISSHEKPEKAKLGIRAHMMHPESNKLMWANFDLPLDFEINFSETSGKYDFAKEIEKIKEMKNVKKIYRSIEERANIRNNILYANEESINKSVFDLESMIRAYRRNVFILLRTFLLIEQYPVKQKFVQQGIDILLDILDKRRSSDV